MESKSEKILKWIQEHSREIGILLIVLAVILIIIASILFKTNQKAAIEVSPPIALDNETKNILNKAAGGDCIVNSDITYKVRDGVAATLDPNIDCFQIINSVTKNQILNLASEMKNLIDESEKQIKTKKNNKLTIPANALCATKFDNCAIYSWKEKSSISTKIRMVVIANTMCIDITKEDNKLDALAYNVIQ